MVHNWLKLKHDEEGRERFFLRAEILRLIRDFFNKEKFLEVETPSLVRLPGMEPYLSPIKVNLSGVKNKFGYLVTSPEYAMKKLLAAGFSKIFQICKSFRGGEEVDRLHNLEFTILEWYRAHANYTDIMRDAENLFAHIAININPKARANSKLCIKYQGQAIDLTPPWPRIKVKEAFKKYSGLDLDRALTRESMSSAAKKKGYAVGKNDSFDDIFFKIFLSEIEPHLGKNRPTILYDWPAEMAALSRRGEKDPRYAERFEIYIGGLELGNAFSELTDWREQRARLAKERKLRKEISQEIYSIDEEFIDALKVGMPPSGGIAMGVDRIVMLFADAKNIEEILFFPAKQIFNL